MVIQLIEINIPYVFKRYVKKYNIYRDLYEIDLLALEVRDLGEELAENTRHIIFRNKEICYIKKRTGENKVDILILGSFVIFRELSKEITAAGNEDLGHKIGSVLKNYSDKRQYNLQLKSKQISLQQTSLMGIVNVTPDSFSDGGKYFDKEKAIDHALKLIEDGALIIDVGGESTRPNSVSVSEKEELERVVPVIEGIINAKPQALISIDTTKSLVAKESIKAGASMINDISAMRFDKKMVEVAADTRVPIVLMHMLGTPQDMQKNPYYDDVILEIYDFFTERIKFAEKNGVHNSLIDPGIGFGKRISDNYEILNRLNEFKGLSKPIVIGLSRKSFLGKSLNLEINERSEATLIAETLAIKNGVDIIRTHEVKQTLTAVKVFSNIISVEN